MSDLGALMGQPVNESAGHAAELQASDTAQAAPGMRPARFSDLNMIHARLMEAIETSPHYGRTFKDFEKARLDKPYLANLLRADPHHIFVPTLGGQPAGFMISGPELGVLWLYWSYIFPEARRNSMAMHAMRSFIAHWDQDGRFHKVSTYIKPTNRVAERIVERYGFEKTCVLKQHIFGEDFSLYECPLNKVSEGYDRGVGIGLKGRARYALQALIGR